MILLYRYIIEGKSFVDSVLLGFSVWIAAESKLLQRVLDKALGRLGRLQGLSPTDRRDATVDFDEQLSENAIQVVNSVCALVGVVAKNLKGVPFKGFPLV